MIEINGWVTICETTTGEDNTQNMRAIFHQIENIIMPFAMLNQILEIKNLNGIPTLFIGLNHNHDIGYSDSIHKLLNEIGRIAVGSYGLLYFRNHENDANTFKVLRLARGIVTLEDDKLLSPCNPIIED